MIYFDRLICYISIMDINIKTVVLSVILSLIGAVIFVSAHTHYYSTTIGVVKVDEIVASHLREFSKKDLGESEIRRASEAFAKALEISINRISERESVLLLVSPAVVSDVVDYTLDVQKEIRVVMRDE